MFQDIRIGFRVLASRPVFTMVAALSLALGIGANSAIFSLIDTLWLRPPAVSRPGEIVRVFSTTDQDARGGLSYAEFLDIQQQSRTLRDVVALGGRGAGLLEGDSRQLVTLNLVSSNFFTALGITAAVGRVFTPEDETGQGGAAPIMVVLGNGFWQRHFGGDRSIVGKQIHIQRVSDVLVTVIGVLPKDFRDIETGDDRDLWFSSASWTTLGSIEELRTRGNRWFRVIGRLSPGSSVRSANAELQTIAAQLATSYPETNRGRSASVIGDLDFRLKRAGQNGTALLGIVLLVVLISSVNVANLLLSRTSSRGSEMSVRLALGASRFRLIRQLMAENLLLNLAGLGLGLLIGVWLIGILPVLMVPPPGFDSTPDFLLDGRVLLFSLGVSLAMLLLFGILPAWKATRPNLIPALKGESSFVGASHRWPLRNFLVVAQVAISLTLLASAAVLVKSFSNTRTSDLGFGRKQLLLVWISQQGVKPSLYRDVISNFEGMPGVRNVAAAVRAPLSLSSNGMFRRVRFPNRPDLAQAPPFEIKYNAVTANFFQTMGTPIIRGRGFDESEEAGSVRSVLINERMAERFWPGEEAVGKAIRLGTNDYSIIGIVHNAPINTVGEIPEPYLYLPYWANFEEEVTFIIETDGEAGASAQDARTVLKRVDTRLNPLGITTENELIRYSAQPYQITAELVGGLGLLGLVLTAVGLYGVISYNVSQRTRELGLRIALGADRRDTLWLVSREVTVMGGGGLLVGLPVALMATRLLTSLLFGVSPWDLTSFVAATAILTLVLMVAGWIPARRATSVEPSTALRVS